ncbi:exported hypothetical protein [Burkholderia sp. 8Y]|uniref:hypothetical protein n=1 Tax=Burkholderia sp. 8Y TaxID=2653133 RepID=UPI0012F0AAB8|nr:hypothetical protein [Burkholderia sp. 8Y]VXB43472.1 exported hypothetical protein [Burkholderia sp. 8Y]
MKSRLAMTALLIALSGGVHAAGGDIGGAAGGAVGGTSGAGMGTNGVNGLSGANGANGTNANGGVGMARGGGIGGANDGTMSAAPARGGMQPPGATRNMSSGVTSPQNTPSPGGGGSRGGW